MCDWGGEEEAEESGEELVGKELVGKKSWWGKEGVGGE